MPVRKGPDCVGEEMSRFRKGELHSGKGGKVVTDPKQAQAIALSACGKSKYAETLQSMGYSEEIANAVTAMFAEIDWAKQFRTGKGPGPEEKDNYDTGIPRKPGRGQLKIGKGPGDGWKQKDDESEMLSPVAYPKGPGNPQGGSSKEVFGMRGFAEPSLEGECDQKAKRKAQAKPRTPAQEQADQARSQALRGKDNMGGNRSAAAKKAAATRAKCKGGAQKPVQPG